MPYQGEFANKSSHRDIIKNPDVSAFLGDCEYLKEPSDQEGEILAAQFQEVTNLDIAQLPEKIISVDGSFYESTIDDRLPSTKIGYVKIGSILIDMTEFRSLRVSDSRLVDPFRVAKLQDNHDALSFSLPSANIRWKNKETVRDGFRAAVDFYLYGVKTRFNPSDPSTSLRSTLFHLAAKRGIYGTSNAGKLLLHKCPNPNCDAVSIEIFDSPESQFCQKCGIEVYATDCLRLWEHVTDYQSNTRAISVFMTVVEHLLPIHYIKYLSEQSLAALSSLAFFVDGPLAIFDVAAWLIDPIMAYIAEINEKLSKAGFPNILMIGLQKTGQVIEHVNLINKFIPPNRIFLINDDYRYKYILFDREPSEKGFGSQTYYGQDFIYKTASEKTFVFGLPYPFKSKPRQGFTGQSAKLETYSELSRALKLISHFETDLYKNAVVPIALAHRYTAISLAPGGRVLDILTKQSLQRK